MRMSVARSRGVRGKIKMRRSWVPAAGWLSGVLAISSIVVNVDAVAIAAEPSDALGARTYNFDGFIMTVTPAVTLPLRRASGNDATLLAAIPRIPPAEFTETEGPLADEPFGEEVSFLPPAPIPPMPVELVADSDAGESLATDGSALDQGADDSDPAAMHAFAEEDATEPVSRVRSSYAEIYNSIPFSRAEYDANPSYRHDATLELMFGKMRPTIIQRSSTRVDVNLPEMAITPWA